MKVQPLIFLALAATAALACGSQSQGEDVSNSSRSLQNKREKSQYSAENEEQRRQAEQAERIRALSPEERRKIIRDFHELYYHSYDETFIRTRYMGIPILKVPTDPWVYQEIIFDLRPDFVVETGTFAGGSAVFMAHILDRLGHGEVITIDYYDHAQGKNYLNESYPNLSDRKDYRPSHPRIHYFHGSSTDTSTLSFLERRIPKDAKVLVILDSAHDKAHVLEEINLYKDFVSCGSYLVVEDTNANDNPIRMYDEGPFQAVTEFLETNSEFEVDRSKEKYLMTLNPGGYLKRVKPNVRQR